MPYHPYFHHIFKHKTPSIRSSSTTISCVGVRPYYNLTSFISHEHTKISCSRLDSSYRARYLWAEILWQYERRIGLVKGDDIYETTVGVRPHTEEGGIALKIRRLATSPPVGQIDSGRVLFPVECRRDRMRHVFPCRKG